MKKDKKMDFNLNNNYARIHNPRNNRGVQVNNNPSPRLIPDDYDDNMTDKQKVVRMTHKLYHERAAHRDTKNTLSSTTLNYVDQTVSLVETSVALSQTTDKLNQTQRKLLKTQKSLAPFAERLGIQNDIITLITEKHDTLNDDFYESLPKDAKDLKDIVHTKDGNQKEKIQSLLTSLSMHDLNIIEVHLIEYAPDMQPNTKKQKTDTI
jgi:hemoglobin-like flavoprotein